MHRFARRVFTWAGVYGLAVLAPQYFMVARIGRDNPPAITHQEYFYGFIGVAIAWQLAFLAIGRDPVRLRPVMLAAVLEKLAFAIPVIAMYSAGRLPASVLFFGLIDLILAGLFVQAYRSTAESRHGSGTSQGLRAASLAGALLLIVGCAAATSLAQAQTPPVTGDDSAVVLPDTAEDMARLRKATKPFHKLDVAVQEGYERDVRQCVAHREHGAMGYHHANPKLMDGRLQVTRPEILVYGREPDGTYRLNGVEYVVPYSSHARDKEPPTIMGQKLLRADGLGIWYLHVWVWRENPSGMFASWNPTIKC